MPLNTHRFGLILALLVVGGIVAEATHAQSAAADLPPVESGFLHADRPRSWSFPADHGSHPQFGTEWWYFTGSLLDETERRFGFELTFFRVGLNPSRPASSSAWRAYDLILAHFAITDVQRERFHLDERVQRAAAGLAGAAVDRLHVWVGEWSVRGRTDGVIELRAGDGGHGLRLEMLPTRGPILHGEAGLSRKTADGTEASYYYSMPRLRTTGLLQMDGDRHRVEGMTWMDHEFFTGASPIEGLGWDWFSLRFEDGRDLMLYRVRHPQKGHHLSGTVVESDGSSRAARVAEATMTPLDVWTSERSGRTYPVAWRVELPQESAVFEVRALLAEQEVIAEESVGFPYWEGLSRASGSWGCIEILGEGYVELTGY
jgi:predicted secreted hydrolase